SYRGVGRAQGNLNRYERVAVIYKDFLTAFSEISVMELNIQCAAGALAGFFHVTFGLRGAFR
ncbi:hypothetical protein, partial [Pseudomonas cannabina]|uniref:hypothetical protein n=1 Tax=Pseudomonas cannabina TaxID=86840 RepID=UPI001C7E2342